MLATGRASLLDAERHSVHDMRSAYYRYHLVNFLYYPIYLTDFQTFASREMGAAVAEQCGSEAALRMEVYDQWANVLRSQADYAVLAQRPRCSRLAQSSARYAIASSYDDLSQLAGATDSRDPDILHLRALLEHWSKTRGIVLPPFTARNQLARFMSSESTRYAAAEAGLKSSC